MKDKLRSILAVFLSFATVFCSMPISAIAEEVPKVDMNEYLFKTCEDGGITSSLQFTKGNMKYDAESKTLSVAGAEVGLVANSGEVTRVDIGYIGVTNEMSDYFATSGLIDESCGDLKCTSELDKYLSDGTQSAEDVGFKMYLADGDLVVHRVSDYFNTKENVVLTRGSDFTSDTKVLVNDAEITDKVYKDSISVKYDLPKSLVDKNIESAIYVGGVKADGTVDTKKLSDGFKDILITMQDKDTGNVYYTLSSIKVQNNKPEVRDLKVEGIDEISNGVGIFHKGVTISGTPYSPFGITSAFIRNDSVNVGNLPYTITEDGDYVLVVRDKNDKVVELTGKELWGNDVDGLKADLLLPYSTFTPSIELVDGAYANKGFDVNIETKAKQGTLASVIVSLNGKVIDSKENLSESYSTVVSIPDKADSYKIVVKSKDSQGYENSETASYAIDKTAPVLGSVQTYNQNYTDINGTVYFNSSIDVVVTYNEYLKYKVVFEDTLTGNKIESDSYSTSLKESGNYVVYAVDSVGNESEKLPLGEKLGLSSNNIVIDVESPSIDYDAEKVYYIKGNKYTTKVSDNCGLASVVVKVNDTEYDSYTLAKDSKKELTYDISLDKIKPVDKRYTIRIEATDLAGNQYSTQWDVVEDTDMPQVLVESSVLSGYTNEDVIARVTVSDANFDASKCYFDGDIDEIGDWSKDDVMNSWKCYIKLTSTGTHKWSFWCKDASGNKSGKYESQEIIIDKLKPSIQVSFSDDSPNGFYKTARTATVAIAEKNFDPASVFLIGGEASEWKTTEDGVSTCNVAFKDDGDHELSVQAWDKAGNVSDEYDSGSFTIDTIAPVVSELGVSDGVSYKNNVAFKVHVNDLNVDTSKTRVTLSGNRVGEIDLSRSDNDNDSVYICNGVPEDKSYDDIYTLNVEAYDKSGNKSVSSTKYSLSRYGSTFTYKSKGSSKGSTSGGINGTTSVTKELGDVEFDEMSAEQKKLENLKIIVLKFGKEIEVPKDLVTIDEKEQDDGTWLYSYKVNKKAFDEDGRYRVQVFELNEESKEFELKTEEEFVLDLTPPEVKVTGIKDDDIIKEKSIRVHIGVKDLTGAADIKAYLIDSKDNKDSIKVLKSGDEDYYLDLEPFSGKRSLSIKVIDAAGNETVVEVKDIVVTTSTLEALKANKDFTKIVLGFILIIALLGYLIFKKVSKKRKKEKSVMHDSIADYNSKLNQELASDDTFDE